MFDEDRGLALRGTFVIDKAGIVRWKVVNPIPQARDIADYQKALASLGVRALARPLRTGGDEMPCYRCGTRQGDPEPGKASPWRRGVISEHQVLICPACQPAVLAELARCPGAAARTWSGGWTRWSAWTAG